MSFEWIQRLRTNGTAWSVSGTVRAVVRVLGNLGSQLEILRLIRQPVLAEVLPFSPRFAIKFATNDYLARNLSVAARKACFVHHYRRLLDTFPNRVLCQILHRNVPILELREGDTVLRVMAYLLRPWDKEGESSLELELDGVGIYILSFTIVPGWTVKSEAPEVLLISRVQGKKGKYKLVQRAMKVMHEVAPAAILLAALQGIAEALEISEILGVSALRQSTYSEDFAEAYRRAYDDFFIGVGAVLDSAGMFRCPVPIPEKPLLEIKSSNRARTKEKRALKRDVADAVRRFFDVNRRMREERSRMEQQSEVSAQLMPLKNQAQGTVRISPASILRLPRTNT